MIKQHRQYQDDSVNLLRKGFKTHLRQVLCLPTGAGKTVVFSDVVEMAVLKHTRCLVVTDRVELFAQTFKALDRAGIEPQVIQASTKGLIDPNALISIAMVETIKRRLLNGRIRLNPELIIIDEAHKRNFDAIIELFPEAKVIGATATPVGKHFHKYYSNIVANIDIPELVKLDFLVPCEAYQMEEDLSDLKTRAGEYTPESLNQHYNKKGLFDGVVREWKTRAKGLKTLIFNVNIQHAENMNAAFLAAGVSSQVITSKTSRDERKKILKNFTDGKFEVLNNCGILTTGYDEPSIECIVLNRATKSLPLFLQCCGRGSRIYKGKERFLVLDFGMNHNQHGLWSQPRNWTLEPVKKKKEEKDVAPVKSCPACEAIINASAAECEFCGYIYPIEKKELRQGVMVEVSPRNFRDISGLKVSQLSLTELAAVQRAKKYSVHFIWRVVRSKGMEAVRDYAKLMDYKQGWRIRQSQELRNCSFSDVYVV